MSIPQQIFPKGQVITFPTTDKGRRRVADLVRLFPASCTPVARHPHQLELLTEFVFQPRVAETALRLTPFLAPE